MASVATSQGAMVHGLHVQRRGGRLARLSGLLLAAGALAAPGQASAAPPPPLLSQETVTTPTPCTGQVSFDAPAYGWQARVTLLAGGDLRPASDTSTLTPGESTWLLSLHTGTVVFACPSTPATLQIEWYAAGHLPVTFASNGPTPPGAQMEVLFNGPNTIQLADLEISGGPLRLGTSDFTSGPTYTSSRGGIFLGDQALGAAYLSTLGSAPTTWSLTVYGAAPEVTLSPPDHTVIRPGVTVSAPFVLNEEALVSLSVVPVGASVGWPIAGGGALAAGAHTTSFDGLYPNDPTNTPLPDGPYSLRVEARANGATTIEDSQPITIDTTPPEVGLRSPERMRDTNPLSVTVYDPGTAVQRVTATLDGRDITPTPIEDGFTYLPRGGFTPGKHLLVVNATDVAGNTGDARLRFTTVGFPAARAGQLLALRGPVAGVEARLYLHAASPRRLDHALLVVRRGLDYHQVPLAARFPARNGQPWLLSRMLVRDLDNDHVGDVIVVGERGHGSRVERRVLIASWQGRTLHLHSYLARGPVRLASSS
jgi:hypothetical protein